MAPRLQTAFAYMAKLEPGAIANPDENRMVGHYWVRNPALAPNPAIRGEIEETILAKKDFASHLRSGYVRGEKGPFKKVLLIVIGGSAPGPQFVANALGSAATDEMAMYCFGNTELGDTDNVLSYWNANGAIRE